MWSARMHVKALMRKHPENEYFRLAVFAFIARGNELADKLRITTNPLELEFNRALKAQSNTPQHPVKLYGTLP